MLLFLSLVITIFINTNMVFSFDADANRTVINMKYYKNLFISDKFFVHQFYPHHQDSIELIDVDGGKYIISKIYKENAFESCYLVRNHMNSYEFCYPSIIVAGIIYSMLIQIICSLNFLRIYNIM